jgi:hypothetical protein
MVVVSITKNNSAVIVSKEKVLYLSELVCYHGLHCFIGAAWWSEKMRVQYCYIWYLLLSTLLYLPYQPCLTKEVAEPLEQLMAAEEGFISLEFMMLNPYKSNCTVTSQWLELFWLLVLIPWSTGHRRLLV